MRWVHKEETAKPWVKGEGALLMIADFVLPDYGWLWTEDGCARYSSALNCFSSTLLRMTDACEVFKPGKNWDGYFTNNNIIQQATYAMNILNTFPPQEACSIVQ